MTSSTTGNGGTGVLAPDRNTEKQTQRQKPPKYKILLHNDDFTPVPLVVEMLNRVFSLSDQEAVPLMVAAHNTGIALITVLPRDAAETKVSEADAFARHYQVPLRTTMEKEE